jgi:hypothetical protein
MREMRFEHPDAAIRQLFRLYETMGSVRGPQPTAEPADRCAACGEGPKIQIARGRTRARKGAPRQTRAICWSCRKPWEGVAWHETKRAPQRISVAHLRDDQGGCLLCRKSATYVAVHKRCTHAGLDAKPKARALFTLDPGAGDADDLRITLDLLVRRMPPWEWRVYGILWCGLRVGNRSEVSKAARRHWPHIPRHLLTDRGVRTLIEDGRKSLRAILDEAGLLEP